MSLGVRVESYSSADTLSEDRFDRGIMYCYIDKIAGRLVMALSISNTAGSMVFVAEDFKGDETAINRPTIERLAVDDNVHAELLPWFATSLPVHLDNGEEALLSIRDIPDIAINIPHTDPNFG